MKVKIRSIGKKINLQICKFPIKLEPKSFETPDDEISVGDFVIHCEHKFLRNIYTEEQIKHSHHVKDLKSYY